MAYDPSAPDEQSRSHQLKIMWWGLPASWLALPFIIFAPDSPAIVNIFGVFAATTAAMMAFAYSYDEFFQAHLWTASRWAMSGVGLMMLVSVFPGLKDLELLSALDLTLGLAIIVTVFHTALAISRWRDR